MGQQLPPKEQGLFKSVVRLYETKQLKKAVKTAEQILKRFPEHGETLAMKGLTLNQMNRKTEAHDLVRRGLMKDMRSHICWHVYGLLYRSNHDYHEAAKAYMNALRLDPENQQITRDLALLQIQIRDYEGYEESRRKLLLVRPSQRNNWIGFALSFHLQDNFAQALQVLETYQNTLDEAAQGDQDPYERSELLFYKVSILEEAGRPKEALEHLERDESRILDRLAFREARARLFISLNRHEDASAELRTLIEINPDNHAYYHELFGVAVLSVEDKSERLNVCLALCDEITRQESGARAPARIALDLIPDASHPQFMARLDNYVRPSLFRGVPSLFSDLKSLYAVPSKAEAIGSLFCKYLEGLTRAPGSMPDRIRVDGGPLCLPSEDTVAEEGSCEVSWVRYFLAQHYDRLGMHDNAFEAVNEAIRLDPKCTEFLLTKARILKHVGDLKGAVEIADAARQMDLSDRFVNTKCVKYALRADMVSEAEAWIALFTRDGDSGGVQALYDMQCMWFELEAAESDFRCGRIPQALKRFIAVERHFADMVEDQFDFHTYCLRKVTLRAYVRTLRMEDKLRCHPYFQGAACGVVRCLLMLEDMSPAERQATIGGMKDVKGFASMSEAERKKALNKMKKREAKRRAKQTPSSPASREQNQSEAGELRKGQESIVSMNGKTNGTGANDVTKSEEATGTSGKASSVEKAKANAGWMEVDPNGVEHVRKLLDPAAKDMTPLLEVSKRISLLEQYAPDVLETHLLAFETAMRKRKALLALRAVRRAIKVDPEHYTTVVMRVRLHTFVLACEAAKSAPRSVQIVLKKKAQVFGGTDAKNFLNEYVVRHEGEVQKKLGGYEAVLWLAKASEDGTKLSSEAMDAILETISSHAPSFSPDSELLTLRFCTGLLVRLCGQDLSIPSDRLLQVLQVLRSKFPRCSRLQNFELGKR